MRKIRKEDYFELAIWLAHHYSGQWSRGYRLYCKLGARYSSADERAAEQTWIYQYLTDHYKDAV